MNPIRHDFISLCLSSGAPVSALSKRRYLDVGCGGGIFAESAARLVNTESVLAIDPSSEVIKVARKHAKHDPLLQQPGRLAYENQSIEDLAKPQQESEQFDVLTLFEVLEHIPRPGPFLDACMPFVKPGGWIVLSTIARSWVSWLTTKVVAEDIIGLVPKHTHDWEQYINEEELRRFFHARSGWGEVGEMRTQGVVYVPGFGWKTVTGSENYGNYFLGVRKSSSREAEHSQCSE